jgi:hypothetical protein
MFPRPICPGQGVPLEIQDCILRCFELHRQRVLQRRAARQSRKKSRQSKYRQSFHTEQYQNLPPQSSVSTSQYQDFIPQPEVSTSQYQDFIPQPEVSTSQYSHLAQDTSQYQDFIPQPEVSTSQYSYQTQDASQYQDFIPQPEVSTSQYSYQTQDASQYQDFIPQPEVSTSQYSYQTQDTSQYQDFIPQPEVSTSQYSNLTQDASQYSNLIQDLPQYHQLLEPPSITAPTQTSQQSTFEYSNVDSSINTSYQDQILPAPEPYHELKDAHSTSKYITPTFDNIHEQSQISSEFKQSEDIYAQSSDITVHANQNTQYQAPVNQVYDSHISNQQLTGSSVPTGTVEYTREAYFSQEPIIDQSNTTSHLQQTQSSSNQQYTDNYSPPAAEQTYNQNIDINQQVVPQQPPIPSPPPSDSGSDEDAKEDQELFDLRACICRCYAKFRESWVKDQQERYQEQFQDIRPPILQTNNQQFQQMQQSISTPTPHYTQPPVVPHFTQPSIPISHPPYNQQTTQQYNEVPIQPFIPQPTYAQTPYIPQEIPTTFPTVRQEQQIVDHRTPYIPQEIQTNFPIARQEQQIVDHRTPYIPQEIPTTFPTVRQEQQIVDHRTPYIPQEIPTNFPIVRQEQQIVDHRTPYIPQIAPSIPTPTPLSSYNWTKTEQPTTYSPDIPAPYQPQYTSHVPVQSQRHEQYIPPPQIPSGPRPPCDEGHIIPRIDARTGLCLVPCPETIRTAHLPTHLRPDLFCTELPPPCSMPPPPPFIPPHSFKPSHPSYIPPQPAALGHRYCVKCCCTPGMSLIKKVVYKQVEG